MGRTERRAWIENVRISIPGQEGRDETDIERGSEGAPAGRPQEEEVSKITTLHSQGDATLSAEWSAVVSRSTRGAKTFEAATAPPRRREERITESPGIRRSTGSLESSGAPTLPLAERAHSLASGARSIL